MLDMHPSPAPTAAAGRIVIPTLTPAIQRDDGVSPQAYSQTLTGFQLVRVFVFPSFHPQGTVFFCQYTTG